MPVATQLDGMLIDGTLREDARFGGVGASGDARELGWEAMASFTVSEHVHWALAPERHTRWSVSDGG